jgi:RNA polymerase sigma factor (sigma-70 family)
VHLAAAVLGDVTGGEDVAQEASYAAYFDIARLRDDMRFGAWFAGITVNLAKMALRRDQRPLSLDSLAGGVHGHIEPEDLHPTPELVIETTELQARVQAALDILPADMRAAVWLHYVEGLSYQEIAGITGMPAGRLRVLSHRARGRLRHELALEWQTRSAQSRKGGFSVEVTVDSVWIRMRKDGEFDAVRRFPRWVLILKEKDGDRAMSLFIGPNEANATAMQLAGLQHTRPQTFTFIARLLSGVKAIVERVTVNELVDDTFLATVSLQAGRTRNDVDARPSDAINLALSTGAPVFVNDAVLQRVGFPYSELMRRLDASIAGQDNEGLEWRSGTEWIQELQEREAAIMTRERASMKVAMGRQSRPPPS